MFSVLIKEIREYRLVTIITPFITLCEVFIDTLMPLLMANIIDKGIEQGDISIVYQTGLLMFLLALVGLLLGYLGGRLSAYASTGYAKNLRKAIYEKVLSFSFTDLDKFSSGSLITRLTTDVHSLQMTYQMMTRLFVRMPANLMVAMLMAFMISGRLASVYLLTSLFLSIVMVLIIFVAMKYFRQVFEAYDQLHEAVQQNVSAIRVVKAYAREKYESSMFAKAAERIYSLFTNAERITAFSQPLMQVGVYVSILMISWLGAQMIVAKELSTGNFMSLLTYCLQIMYSLMMLGMIFVNISMSSASARRIAEVLALKETPKSKIEPTKEWVDSSVVFDNVSFHYPGGKDVIKNVSFTVKKAETLGIIGAIGSGKTSLVSLLTRFYDASEGSISIGGKNIKEYDTTFLRQKIGIVLQKNELFRGTIYDNLRWGKLDASQEECHEAARIAQAEDFILRLPKAYDFEISQGGKNVSGGQKQRLCIARAVIKKPEILIFDDATSALDTLTEKKVRKALKEAFPNTTTIIIAQRISSIEDADKILVLEEGKVNAIGTHQELLESNSIYRSLYQTQQKDSDFDERGDENVEN